MSDIIWLQKIVIAKNSFNTKENYIRKNEMVKFLFLKNYLFQL